MIREEAITIIKAFMDNPLFSDVHKAAFSIAIHDIKQRHDWDINKLMLVPKTEWEQEPTTKNNLGVDAVSRQAINEYIDYILTHGMGKKKSFEFIKKFVANMPPVTPQEPIIDKLRAEIENDWQLKKYPSSPFSCGLRRAIEIIDKYKAESEG